MPYIQPIIETLQDDPTNEDFEGMPVPPPATEGEWDAYYAREIAQFTADECEVYGQRAGESDIEHCRRLSDYVFRDRD